MGDMENDKTTKTSGEKSTEKVEYPIIGKSKAVDQLLKQISRLSKTKRDILIIGEPGVGKGAVAKNIHGLAKGTDDSPFASLNLSVLDDRELESILFGFDLGAEGISSSSTKRGLFEIANNGTVLIEEIEEASFRNQMKILNFMNERVTRRLGSSSGEAVDIRLIITMKSDPKELLERRKLLEGLYNKVSEFERVEIQPLRERPEDIPILVKYYTSEICRELGINELIIDINAIEILVRQPWKENIRELKAVIDKSVLFSTGGRFTLPQELIDEKTEVVKMLNNLDTNQEFVLENSLDMIEKGIIERALNKFGFNQTKAAHFLGMTEQTLRYKLKRLGVASTRVR
jgi:DNA-binding NtrC family response regulator